MSTGQRSRFAGIGRWLPGLLISFIAILLLAQLADWRDVIQALMVMRPSALLLAILCYLIGLGLRALTWMTLLQNRAPYRRVFLTLNEGYLLNNILPLRLGELGRVLLLSQSAHLSAFFVFSTIIIERAYDLALMAGLVMATLPFVFGLGFARTAALATLGLVVLAFVVLFVLARQRESIKRWLAGQSGNHPFLRGRIYEWSVSFLDGLSVLTRPGQFLLSLAFILLSWFFGALEIHSLLNSGPAEAPLWWAGFALGVASLGIALPSAPAGLGVYEVAMVGALSALGFPPGQALAVAIVAHLIHIAISGVIGISGLSQEGQTVTGLYNRLRSLNRLNVPG